MRKKCDKYGTPLCFDNGEENFSDYYNDDLFNHFNQVFSTNDLDAIIELNPHYSDYRFKEAQTVFGKEEKGLDYVYNDRLYQWNYKKHEESWNKTKEEGFNPKTARFYQEYLSKYYDKSVEIKHIIAGVNVSSGYPYQAFGFKFKEE